MHRFDGYAYLHRTASDCPEEVEGAASETFTRHSQELMHSTDAGSLRIIQQLYRAKEFFRRSAGLRLRPDATEVAVDIYNDDQAVRFCRLERIVTFKKFDDGIFVDHENIARSYNVNNICAMGN